MDKKSRVFTLDFVNTRADFVAWRRKEKRTRERLEVAAVIIALPSLIVLIALSIFVA